MRVLVTGSQGYLGPPVVEELLAAGHEVVGLDVGFYADDAVEPGPSVRVVARDIREVELDDLEGFEAIVHLAGLSNDPLGQLDPTLTREINVDATMRLAQLARRAGIRRFVNSSSCSVYGASAEDWVDEQTELRPLTAYAVSKVEGERALATLADERFCPISFRSATAFGYSPNFRTDLVVNDLTVNAVLHGTIRLNSDGTAWRPLVHVSDIAQAAALALVAPAERICGQVINVGSDEQNYQVLEIAGAVASRIPAAAVSFAENAGADRRSYRVRFRKLRDLLPGFRPRFDLSRGVDDLVANIERVGPDHAAVSSRLSRLQELRSTGKLDPSLRFIPSLPAPSGPEPQPVS